MHDYLDRKLEELRLICAYIPNYKFVSPSTILDALNEKEKITKELKKYYAEKYYHELTNKDRYEIKNPFVYKYTYERFNGFIEINNFANDFYLLNKSIYTNSYFSNCGMSAICSLLSSIISSNNINIDLMYEETYFETIKYISMIMKNKSNKKMLYIDSIASDFNFIDKISLDNYIGIVIDTTCYLGKDYRKMIKTILESNKMCILIRSHTKLDLMGAEFSHVGSVSFIYSDKNRQNELFNKIENECRHLIGVMGACLPPERFPQFMLNKEIKLLNEKRLLYVCKNNKYCFKLMTKKGIDCSIPNHKLFCLINFENHNLSLERIKKEIINFCDMQRKQIPVFHAVSFGFDYISLDCYENYKDGKFKIRICMNDMPREYINVFIRAFVLFYNSLI